MSGGNGVVVLKKRIDFEALTRNFFRLNISVKVSQMILLKTVLRTLIQASIVKEISLQLQIKNHFKRP